MKQSGFIQMLRSRKTLLILVAIFIFCLIVAARIYAWPSLRSLISKVVHDKDLRTAAIGFTGVLVGGIIGAAANILNHFLQEWSKRRGATAADLRELRTVCRLILTQLFTLHAAYETILDAKVWAATERIPLVDQTWERVKADFCRLADSQTWILVAQVFAGADILYVINAQAAQGDLEAGYRAGEQILAELKANSDVVVRAMAVVRPIADRSLDEVT